MLKSLDKLSNILDKTNSLQKFFKQAFVSVRVFWMFVFSLRLMIDENAIDVDGNSLKTLLKTFLTLVKRLTLFSDIISSNMNYEIIWLFLDYHIQFL